jgi:hypothetical protein
MHLTAGYAALTARDFRVDPSHPPIARMWAALPLALSAPTADFSAIDRTAPRDWLSSGYAFARTFVSTDGIDARLLRARAMVVAGGVLLGLLIFMWAREWQGLRAAVVALGLFALEPNLAAHTAVVTTDGLVTVLIFAAVYCLWRYVRTPTARDLALLAACTGLACVTKFSAVLLAPIILVLMAIAVVNKRISASRGAMALAVIAASTVLAIWMAYGFRYAPSSNPQWLFTHEAFGTAVDRSWLAATINWLDAHRLLPNAFAQGFLYSVSSVRELPGFLAGDVRSGGWWYYFPTAIALKTPLALLLLGVAGIAALVIRRSHDTAMTLAFVLVPVVIWLVAAAYSGVNVGIRHVLPVFPFLVLLAAAGAAECLARRGAARALAAAAVLAMAVEVGRSEPYPLSFFNVLAGGPPGGYRYLADSNLAWGGHVKGLKRWMDERGVSTINLAYFGSVDPAVYGVRATYLPSSAGFLADRFTRPQLPGYVAISGTALDGVYLPAWLRRFYAGFHDREPVAVVANTLRIYWVDRWPEPTEPMTDLDSLQTLADGLLFGLRWPEHAVVHYDEYLQSAPRDPEAWNGRSMALAQLGRTSEAIEGFRRVLALAPTDPDARRNIALLEQQATRPLMAER